MITRPKFNADAWWDFFSIIHFDEFPHLKELAFNAELRQNVGGMEENYGGFWFLTSYDAVSQNRRTATRSSINTSRNAADGVDYQGGGENGGHPSRGQTRL